MGIESLQSMSGQALMLDIVIIFVVFCVRFVGFASSASLFCVCFLGLVVVRSILVLYMSASWCFRRLARFNQIQSIVLASTARLMFRCFECFLYYLIFVLFPCPFVGFCRCGNSSLV